MSQDLTVSSRTPTRSSPVGANVVAEARRWIDTPVAHRGRKLGVGVDCVGLVIMVGLALKVLQLPDVLSDAWAKYGLLPNPESMRRALDTYLVRVAGDHQDGDIGRFSLVRDGPPMHLAIMSTQAGRPAMIHARADIRRKRVVETGYAATWPEWNQGFWRYPGIA